LTHGEILLELQDIMRPDSRHFMADAYRRGLPSAHQYIEGLYQALPDAGRMVDIAEELSVTVNTPVTR